MRPQTIDWVKIEKHLKEYVDICHSDDTESVEWIESLIMSQKTKSDVMRNHSHVMTNFFNLLKIGIKNEKFETCQLIKECIELETENVIELIDKYFIITDKDIDEINDLNEFLYDNMCMELWG